MKMLKTYFSAMGSMNCGKASSHFQEIADELRNIVLTNKTFQTTRFARSLQRANTAALRNLPTLVNVISKEYNSALKIFDHTRALELKPTLDDLLSAKRLFYGIALAQLLEIYCEASLEAQYASHFPIQVQFLMLNLS